MSAPQIFRLVMGWEGYAPYEGQLQKPVNTSPHNVPLSSAEQSRKEVKADIAKNVGFRGRHNHGKSLDDPVYPTKKVIPQLRPKTLIDWRTGGRALLISALAVLERRARLRKRTDILDFQSRGFCGPACGYTCAKDKRRILCAWKVPGTEHEHFNKISDHLVAYKGLVKTKKPFFAPPRPVAQVNAASARFFVLDTSTSTSKPSHFIRSPKIDEAALYHSLQDPARDHHEVSPNDSEANFILHGSFHL